MSKKLEWKEIKSKYTGWSLSSIKHFYSCRKTEPLNTEFQLYLKQAKHVNQMHKLYYNT